MKIINNSYLDQIEASPEKGRSIMMELREKAKKSDVEAARALVIMLIAGLGVEKNLAQGIKTAEAIARDKKLHEMNELLGHIFKYGMYGVVIDHAQAEAYYRLSAKAELPDAARELAKYYLDGEHFTRDLSEALRWFKVAADKDEPESLGFLGSIYLTGGNGLFGDYIQSNHKLAIEYLTKASSMGVSDASETLLYHYLRQAIALSRKVCIETPENRSLKSSLAELSWIE